MTPAVPKTPTDNTHNKPPTDHIHNSSEKPDLSLKREMKFKIALPKPDNSPSAPPLGRVSHLRRNSTGTGTGKSVLPRLKVRQLTNQMLQGAGNYHSPHSESDSSPNSPAFTRSAPISSGPSPLLSPSTSTNPKSEIQNTQYKSTRVPSLPLGNVGENHDSVTPPLAVRWKA